MNRDGARGRAVQPEYFCVAFLDLLGQKTRLDAIARLPLPVQDTPELREQFEQVFTPVRNFHDCFFDALDVINSIGTGRPPHRDGPAAAGPAGSVAGRLKYQAFGDSVFLYLPIDLASPSQSDARLIRGLLLALGWAMVGMMNEGVFPRGGIDIHIAADLGYGVYGPAACSAYRLESCEADYPRIVVGSGFCSYLESIGASIPSLSEFSGRVTWRDTDDLAILDYLGEAFRQEKQFDPAVVKEAYGRAKALLDSFRQKGDTHLRAKYGRLVHYFESRVNLWSDQGIFGDAVEKRGHD